MLLVAVAALLVACRGVESLHGRRLGEVVVVGQLHGAQGGAAVLHAAAACGHRGLRAAVVLVDAARHGGGATQLVEAVQLLGQVGQIRRDLLVAQREKLIMWRVEDLLEASLVENTRPTSNNLQIRETKGMLAPGNNEKLFYCSMVLLENGHIGFLRYWL